MYEPLKSRYDALEIRRCGRSGVRLPLLSVGLWHNFGASADYQTACDILKTAFDNGLYHFDLANNYGPPPGSAEQLFGRIYAENFRPYRRELFISTKAGYLMWPGPFGEWGARKTLLTSLDESLARMNLDYVDLFYSHRFDPQTPLEETVGALVTAVEQGKALYVGISNYPPEATVRAAQLLRQAHVPCLIHQQRYNIFDNAPEETLFPTLRAENMGMIAFSPLAQGLLTDRYINGIPPDSRAGSSSPFLNAEKVNKFHDKILKLHKLALLRGQTLAQMALAYVLDNDVVTSALIGVSSVAQLRENLAALKNRTFTTSERQAITMSAHENKWDFI